MVLALPGKRADRLFMGRQPIGLRRRNLSCAVSKPAAEFFSNLLSREPWKISSYAPAFFAVFVGAVFVGATGRAERLAKELPGGDD